MIIQLNTDNNISGTEALENFVKERVNHELKNFTEHITRVEVHLSDQNANKGGTDDILCKLEVRLEGKQPVLVTSKNSSKEVALNEAANKMKAKLNTVIGKMKSH